MRNLIAEGNEMYMSHYAVNGLTDVVVKLTNTGEDECCVYIENGIMYAYKNTELVVCSNLFRVVFNDKTK